MASARILLVEDEAIVAMDIQNSLKGLGYAVPVVASSGEEAIEELSRTLPDLVLMDIMLQGDMDGVEAAELIRERFDIPVVYLTACADDITLGRAKVTEPFGYILKPFEERMLHITIEMSLYKHKMERKLRESEQWLSTVLRCIGDAVVATDAAGHIKFMNPIAEALTGWKQEQALGMDLTEVFNVMSETGSTEHLMLVARDGTQTPIDETTTPIWNEIGQLTGSVIVFRDATQRTRAEAEQKLRLLQLQDALTKVKMLGGFSPICSSCKKIRDDEEYWKQLEAYLQKYSHADLGHHLCPECAQKFYSELYEKDN